MMMNSYKFNQKNSEVYLTTVDFEQEYLKVSKDAKQGKLKQFDKKSMTHEQVGLSEPLIPDGQTSMQI